MIYSMMIKTSVKIPDNLLSTVDMRKMIKFSQQKNLIFHDR